MLLDDDKLIQDDASETAQSMRHLKRDFKSWLYWYFSQNKYLPPKVMFYSDTDRFTVLLPTPYVTQVIVLKDCNKRKMPSFLKSFLDDSYNCIVEYIVTNGIRLNEYRIKYSLYDNKWF